MKSERKKSALRSKRAAPGFAAEPAIVPTRPVAFEELERRGWVHVMGEAPARERRKRRP
jgi:hypothetical protein